MVSCRAASGAGFATAPAPVEPVLIGLPFFEIAFDHVIFGPQIRPEAFGTLRPRPPGHA